jgi:hypothetical protein
MNFWEKIASFLREDADVSSLQAEFNSFVESQVNEKINGVISNKDKILGEKKQVQAELDALREKFGRFEEANVSFNEYEQLQVELEALRKNSDTPEDVKEREKMILSQGKSLKEKELVPEIEKLRAQVDTLNSELSNYQNRYHKYRVQNEVVSTLQDMGVEYDDIWLEGLLSRSKFEYIESEDRLDIELYSPENKSVVPLADWKRVFPNSVQGKRMIKAPANVGGSASGGGGRDGKKGPVNPKDLYSGLFQ